MTKPTTEQEVLDYTLDDEGTEDNTKEVNRTLSISHPIRVSLAKEQDPKTRLQRAWAVKDDVILADTGEDTHFGNIRVTGKDLRTLCDKQWINDEIVNFLLASSQECMSRPTGNA